MIILAYNDKQNKELAVNIERNRKFNNHPLVMQEISCFHVLSYKWAKRREHFSDQNQVS